MLTKIHFIFIYQDKNVHMIVVGIGKGVKDSELKITAGEKGDYVHPKDFDDLYGILGEVKDDACGTVLIFLFILSSNINPPINILSILKPP